MDSSTGDVTTALLDFGVANQTTARNTFEALNDKMKIDDPNWENCLPFSCDNTSVMLGKHNSVSTDCRDKARYLSCWLCMPPGHICTQKRQPNNTYLKDSYRGHLRILAFVNARKCLDISWLNMFCRLPIERYWYFMKQGI